MANERINMGKIKEAMRLLLGLKVYRTDEIRYESDFYNQLMASPAVMIKDQAQVRLKESPAIEFVLLADVAANPYYLIDGKVLEF